MTVQEVFGMNWLTWRPVIRSVGVIEFSKIALDSGFKCNSAVWYTLVNVKQQNRNPWNDAIKNQARYLFL